MFLILHPKLRFWGHTPLRPNAKHFQHSQNFTTLRYEFMWLSELKRQKQLKLQAENQCVFISTLLFCSCSNHVESYSKTILTGIENYCHVACKPLWQGNATRVLTWCTRLHIRVQYYLPVRIHSSTTDTCSTNDTCSTTGTCIVYWSVVDSVVPRVWPICTRAAQDAVWYAQPWPNVISGQRVYLYNCPDFEAASAKYPDFEKNSAWVASSMVMCSSSAVPRLCSVWYIWQSM